MKSYLAEGIVLSRRNIGEADKLVIIFTKQYGKKTVLGKGIRKINSRRGPYLEPFSHIRLNLHQGKTFDYISEVIGINTFAWLRQSLSRISLAFIVLELVNRLMAEQQPSRIVFSELIKIITDFNSPQITEPQMKVELAKFKQFLLIELGFLDAHTFYPETVIDGKIEAIIEAKLKSPQLLTDLT